MITQCTLLHSYKVSNLISSEGFEDLTAVFMNVAIFRDTALFSLYVNRRFGVKYRLHLQDRKSTEQETSVWATLICFAIITILCISLAKKLWSLHFKLKSELA
jgi:hypothetical protein